MNKAVYDRQQKLNLTQVKSAIVVGCGGTGSWTALFLAMSGCENLVLFDSDQLEPSNFNRLPLPEEAYVGKNKALAIKELIENVRPDCIVEAQEERATDYTLDLVQADIIFDCTDSQATQTLLSKYAKAKGLQYIRVGYNGTHITVTNHVSTWCTKDDPRAGYTIIPSWVVGAALPACIGVAKAMYAPELDVSMDIKEIGRAS